MQLEVANQRAALRLELTLAGQATLSQTFTRFLQRYTRIPGLPPIIGWRQPGNVQLMTGVPADDMGIDVIEFMPTDPRDQCVLQRTDRGWRFLMVCDTTQRGPEAMMAVAQGWEALLRDLNLAD